MCVCVCFTDDACVCCSLILAGMFIVIPCTDSYSSVDLRTRPFDVTPQEVSLSVHQ